MINKILNYLFIVSPVLITSLFIPYSKFPAWAVVILVGSLISSLYLSSYVYKNWKGGKVFGNFAVNSIVAIFSIIAIFSTLNTTSLKFAFWGKGIEAFSVVSLLSFAAVFFLASHFKNKQNKTLFYISLATIVISLVSFYSIKYAPSIGNYIGFLTVPMISFGALINYSIFYSLAIFLGSGITFISDKKNFSFSNKFSNKFKYLYAAIAIVLLITAAGNTLRFVAASDYLQAIDYANQGKLDEANKSLSSAIAIAPFDTYYLTRIEITKIKINNLIAEKSTNTEKLQKDFTTLVNSQIDDAKKAVAYDSRNPQNYLALGAAYESAISLTGDEAYKKALESYDTVRKLVTDKDYIDTLKAKLAFGAQKEQEGLTFLDEALKYNASSSSALYTSSQYFAAKKDYKSATDYAEKAVLSNPNAQDARMNLGILYFVNKDYQKAIDQFKIAFQLKQDDNLALYYLAIAYKTNNNLDFAKQVVAELEKRVGETAEVKELKESLDVKVESTSTSTKK